MRVIYIALTTSRRVSTERIDMKKKSSVKAIRLNRETLLRLDHEQLSLPQGGGTGTEGYTNIPCQTLGGSVKCSVTGCGDC
jgi:hypothetical protein